MERIKRLWRRPGFRFVAVMLILWAAIAIPTDAPDMFLIGNALLASLSVAVMVAYGKVAWDAIKARRLTPTNLLALGIFLSWSGTACLRILSVLIYGLHKPAWIGTDFSTFAVQLQLMAAVLHLAAPEVEDSGILPVREWVKMGLVAGGAVLVLLALFIWRLI